ncbi:alcohol dehydrogenase catalytic domain-containing protein [Acuticoccus mangrovi]|uniref:alcohol dehydrogenase n=1 Tax=Acuticoccus mangrovi TaxID=2796142 RepID=A0A934MJB6_9HYPH|nr:alcohol dehydrogenase catalytic domain-containing protein [Acuticoccus mangrovi]MBJ3778121.1 alcohol dehydrogenase catalytic domain-containing protein [Acuticoccus mangrovi]
MRAVVVDAPGGLEVLQMREVPDPVPGPKDVVIAVDSCGVCYHDIVTRNGTLKAGVHMPLILGHEIAGTVADVGSAVTRFRRGERVATVQRYHICGACEHCREGYEPLCPDKKFLGDHGLVGGYGEYVAVEDDNVCHVPDGVALEAAAITACTLGTVYNAMTRVSPVKAGETILVTGASGGLGLHAVQLGAAQGARVIAQTTSPAAEPLLRELGADEVVVHGRGEDFSSAVRALTGGRGVDVAVDNVGTLLFQPTRKSIALRGRWLIIGQLTGDFVPFNPAQLFLRGISMLAATSTTREQLAACLALVARGKVRPVVEAALPLGEAAEAHRRMEAGSVTGRLVLKPGVLQ